MFVVGVLLLELIVAVVLLIMVLFVYQYRPPNFFSMVANGVDGGDGVAFVCAVVSGAFGASVVVGAGDAVGCSLTGDLDVVASNCGGGGVVSKDQKNVQGFQHSCSSLWHRKLLQGQRPLLGSWAGSRRHHLSTISLVGLDWGLE